MKFRDDFPLPDTDWPPARPFWAAAARGELALPRCDGCRRLVWYPDGTCRRCGGGDFTWTAVSGRGRLFSWSVVHRAFIPEFAGSVPYVSALVTPDEDAAVRIVTRIVDCEPAALRIDMPVHVVFRTLSVPGRPREVVAPCFAPLASR
jgi:hypothetical protein